MEIVTIRQAKADLSRLIARVCRGRGDRHRSREEAGCPHDRASGRAWQSRTGGWKGKILYGPDGFAPLTDQEMKDLGFE